MINERHLASSGVDVYTAMAGGASALYGPKHGGANEAVLRMLESIGSVRNIPQFIQDVKDRKKLLMGFGHRVYKNYDPRATIVKKIADEVFEITGKEPLIEIAMELEKIALSDEYFIKRKVFRLNSFTPTWISILAAFTRLWVSLRICLSCCSLFLVWPDGSPIGKDFIVGMSS